MSVKTKAENLRLFQEARSLKESLRYGLHEKAMNATGASFSVRSKEQISMQSKVIKKAIGS